MILALDGHSGCGKSTLARDLARRLGFVHIDTGALFRLATLCGLERGLLQPDNEGEYNAALRGLRPNFRRSGEGQHLFEGDRDVEALLRSAEVSGRVSEVAARPQVREVALGWERSMAEGRDVVMDGRDIGTVVFPNADLKLFVTARPEVRAQRRYDELRAKGDDKTTYDAVLANLLERDRLDSERDVAPLRQADDAILLDNSDLDREQQLQAVLDLIRNKKGKSLVISR